MDQCKHCVCRGNFDECRKASCSYHECWGFKEAVERAFMAGKKDGGDDPIYNNAQLYFNKVHVSKV